MEHRSPVGGHQHKTQCQYDPLGEAPDATTAAGRRFDLDSSLWLHNERLYAARRVARLQRMSLKHLHRGLSIFLARWSAFAFSSTAISMLGRRHSSVYTLRPSCDARGALSPLASPAPVPSVPIITTCTHELRPPRARRSTPCRRPPALSRGKPSGPVRVGQDFGLYNHSPVGTERAVLSSGLECALELLLGRREFRQSSYEFLRSSRHRNFARQHRLILRPFAVEIIVRLFILSQCGPLQ